ncbi:MAG: hypothetical protein WKG00_01430 [Polyangiaceae bacterium]
MRGKIIAVFAVIVLIVGGLSYALTRATLGDLATPGDAPRALAAGILQLKVDGLVLERWLAEQVGSPRVREPFQAGTANARAEAATAAANVIRDAAAAAPELAGISPALVVLVDKAGVVVGRNGSALMRGDNLAAAYPALKGALDKGVTGSDVWVSSKRNEQLLASYAAIRGADGAVIGGLAVGTPLNGERLSNTSDRTSGHILVVAVRDGDKLDIVGRSADASPELLAKLAESPAKDGSSRRWAPVRPSTSPACRADTQARAVRSRGTATAVARCWSASLACRARPSSPASSGRRSGSSSSAWC